MQPQLAAVLFDLDTASRRVHALAQRLDDGQWHGRADPARWSPAECVAHLVLTAEAYLPLLAAALAQARELGPATRTRYRRDMVGWLLGTLSGPRRRLLGRSPGAVATAPAFVPAAVAPRAELLAAYDRAHAGLGALLRSAEGWPIDRVTVTSAFDARVRYNAFAAFVILGRHELRHAQQAEGAWPAG